MGLLLVFFPEDHHHSSTTTILDSSSSPSSSTTAKVAIKRTNSNRLLTKVQSTISICVLLLFLTLLLFTLSTFEPSLPAPNTPSALPRRFLSDTRNRIPLPNKPSLIPWFTGATYFNEKSTKLVSSFALQGMGKIYMRGTRAMPDLLICHVSEDTPEDDFKIFLRVLHRSGLTSRADVVFLFPSSSFSNKLEPFIREENDSFLKLLNYYRSEKKSNGMNQGASAGLGFDVTRFWRSGKKEIGEPLWGKKAGVISGFNESGRVSNETESTRLSYGSVVSFEASELDPENSLAGFLDHVPVSLRRWACYPMLLGRVRRNFKHVMLVDVKNSLLLGDPLSRVRNLSSESVLVIKKQESNKRNSDKTRSHYQVNSAVLMGGARGIRRFSSSLLTEIVRAAVQQHKRRNSVHESVVLGQLVGNHHILKNVDLVESTESVPDSSSLTGSSPTSRDYRSYYSVIQRGNGNRELNSVIVERICACEADSLVYRDC